MGNVFGVAEVRANLFGSPKRAEKWLSGKLGLTLTEVWAGMEEGLDAETLSFAVNLRGAAGADPTVDSFLRLLKEGARSANAQAKAAQELVEELEHVSGSYVSDADLEKAKIAEEDGAKAINGAQHIHAQMGQLKEAHDEYQQAGKELTLLSKELVPAQAGGLACARSIQEAINRAVLHFPNSTVCLCCHTPLENGVATLHSRLKEISEYIAHMEETEKLVNRRAILETTVAQAKERGSHLLSLIPPRFLSNKGALAEALEVAQLRHSQARAHLDELQRRRVSSQSPGMAQATVEGKLRNSALYQTAADCMEKIVKEKVATTLEAFNKALAIAYPTHFGTPVLTLRPQVSVSVQRKSGVGVPSGGEEALLLFAIAGVLAYLQKEDGGEGTNVLVMEDRGLDVETLNSLIPMWKGCEYAQVLVPTTTKTTVETDGWKVLSYWPIESESESVANGNGTYNVDLFDLHA